ncbi:GNAT family N-acetyltransferase [Pseudoroseomonas ludipueritiae]|uniref:GNAT family N-acetyltransferase n=1 Tax=Pseudoroseomonas ludipueritiae TaxID=198093 RepID=A0ABR7R8V7_9PROT|nr:GNAT family N-acetyltransferase [Pseudoroseomonas ludipueritiae]MBC9178123.1 GNAT family N-acetyltransferase [Pseudoroseomonas ludipueritiae]MCG7364122.1 GNAT family N-acetyltransferase [Roseomonas sp. ACRSG]
MSAEPTVIQGPRIRLRPWREEDREALAAMNADPEVMRHFPEPLSREQSDALMDRINASIAQDGFGFWAVERHDTPGIIGFCGLARVRWEARFTPAVEIGWRFATAHQRQGYAEEAARIALAHGFGPLKLEEIVAFTLPANLRSWGLMERLGMRQDGDFEHPRLPEGHPMRRHLLYRLSRRDWIDARLGGG